MARRAPASGRWLAQSPGVDPDFSVTRYLLHLARSSVGVTRAAVSRPRLRVGADEIGITFVGHATVLI